jgi:hypothetical protein
MLENAKGGALERQLESAGEAESPAPGAEQRVPSLMTPAKRAGLDALEREFSELLKKRRT